MVSFRRRTQGVLTLLMMFAAAARAAGPGPAVTAFLAKHCAGCHDASSKTSGLDVTSLGWEPDSPTNLERWILLHDRVSKGQMPPPSESTPPKAAKSEFLTAVRNDLLQAVRQSQSQTGRVVLRRLNRVEYERSVQDLLSITTPLKDRLPEDTPALGFDTVAEGQRLSQPLIERYLEAADIALDEAIQLGPKPAVQSKRYSLKDVPEVRRNVDTPMGAIPDKNSGRKHVKVLLERPDAIVMFSDTAYQMRFRGFRPPIGGLYRVRVSGYAYQTHGGPAALRCFADSFRAKQMLAWFDMPADQPRVVEFVGRFETTENLALASMDIGYDENGVGVYAIGAESYTGRGLAIQWAEIEGPLVDQWPPVSTAALVGADCLQPLAKRTYRNGKHCEWEITSKTPAEDLTKMLTRFAERAFRRPLREKEIDRYLAIAQQALTEGRSLEDAVRVGVRMLLTAPQFLFFEEPIGRLDNHALAQRLSYFLWSAPPDAELRQLADDRRLLEPETLRRQVDRMLKEDRSGAFVENFVGQWLDLRSIDATTPDRRLYPEFDELLQASMLSETHAFFREMLDKNLPPATVIDSDFVMINRRLAEHYGIDGVTGEQVQRVSLPVGSPRGGVLTQASVLKVSANGTVTSPVLRGAWVLKRLLDDPPPPPPPNVGSIEPDTRGASTIRELLAKHRSSDDCNRCHAQIDPPGFALENFDVIGGWQDRYRSQDKGDRSTVKFKNKLNGHYKLALAVDASGQLPDGQSFNDIRDFKRLLLDRQDQVTRCLVVKLIIYATGAGISFADRPGIDDLCASIAKEKLGLREIVQRIVASELFQTK